MEGSGGRRILEGDFEGMDLIFDEKELRAEVRETDDWL